MNVVTLLTDFGTRDPYVAAMKGVILSGVEHVQLIDISHEILPQDLQTAILTLADVWSYFPAGTLHMAIVDPGVGTDRKRLIVEAGGHFFVGPDNGLFGFACDIPGARFWEITGSFDSSQTFEGRDVFAKTVVRLCQGEPLSDLAKSIPTISRLEVPSPTFGERTIAGEIVGVDRFGNLISNIRAPEHFHGGVIRTETGRLCRLVRTYAEGNQDEVVAIWNSFGRLELSVREGSAREILPGDRGTRLTLEKSL